MAVLLVDYENVSMKNGLKGIEYLNANDRLIIFYSQCCPKIRRDCMEAIRSAGSSFQVYKLKKTGKNALDFYIAAECGYVSHTDVSEIAIISNDKGFDALIDFLKLKAETQDIQLIRAANIEKALMGLNSPADSRRKEILCEKSSLLDLAAEYGKYEERNAMHARIKDALPGTKYENRTAEIIDFATARKDTTRKELYTGTLRLFGKSEGTDIYRILKDLS